jgi:hypothetical protein
MWFLPQHAAVAYLHLFLTHFHLVKLGQVFTGHHFTCIKICQVAAFSFLHAAYRIIEICCVYNNLAGQTFADDLMQV